jgi:hypothetical protein
VSDLDPAARLHAIGAELGRRAPGVLAALISLLEAVLATAALHLRPERTPTAPGALTAEQVLEAARGRGIPAFGEPFGARLILLASLGLDLTDPEIRAALVDLHRRGELRLARIGPLGAARADLAARGLRADLIDESALSDGNTTFHAVALS